MVGRDGINTGQDRDERRTRTREGLRGACCICVATTAQLNVAANRSLRDSYFTPVGQDRFATFHLAGCLLPARSVTSSRPFRVRLQAVAPP